MSFEFKKNLKLLVPRYKLNDLTTRRIALFALVIPFLFGGLAVWFSYTKVSYTEKKYGDMYKKLAEARTKLNTLKARLDSSEANISSSDQRLKRLAQEYTETHKRLRDSLDSQKYNISSLHQVYSNVEKSYALMQDSNRQQSALLNMNYKKIRSSGEELERFNDSLEWMRYYLKKSKDSLNAATANVGLMKSSLENVKGEASRIRPQARSRTLFGQKDKHDRQLFEFQVWLDIPKDLRKNISEVVYKYTLLPEDEGVTTSSLQSVIVNTGTDYKTSFPASGCISNMIIEVRFRNNLSTPLLFDVCQAINTPLIAPLPVNTK